MAIKNKKYIVRSIKPRTRIVDYAGDVIPLLGSKSAAKKAIDTGRLYLNGRKANSGDFVNKGDSIQLKGTGISKIKAYITDVDVIYEDESLIIVNKPGGIAVNGNRFKTMENALIGVAKDSKEMDALPRPIAVHRIDVPTKGLVMFAKTKSALIKLGTAFQNGEIEKEYQAVVHGQLPKEGKFDQLVDGKKSVTTFENIKTIESRIFGFLSLAKLFPKTGRKHQIRLHLKENGYLVLGDKMYAEKRKTILGKGMFLCSCRLAFQHPKTNEKKDIRIKPPKRFLKLMDREGKRF